MHRDVSPLDALELGFELLLAGIDHHLRTLAKDHFLDLDEAEQPSLGDLLGVDLVNFALVEELDSVNMLCYCSSYARDDVDRGRYTTAPPRTKPSLGHGRAQLMSLQF